MTLLCVFFKCLIMIPLIDITLRVSVRPGTLWACHT
jgi:hypothetical protein